MGCPEWYYKRALQNLAYALTVDIDKKLANKLYKETSEQKLKAFINKKQEEMPTEQFFFKAGMSFGEVLNDADQNDGNDGFNACAGGLSEFAAFIGVKI